MSHLELAAGRRPTAASTRRGVIESQLAPAETALNAAALITNSRHREGEDCQAAMRPDDAAGAGIGNIAAC